MTDKRQSHYNMLVWAVNEDDVDGISQEREPAKWDERFLTGVWSDAMRYGVVSVVTWFSVDRDMSPTMEKGSNNLRFMKQFCCLILIS